MAGKEVQQCSMVIGGWGRKFSSVQWFDDWGTLSVEFFNGLMAGEASAAAFREQSN